ncbi:MAG: aminopeptidase P N-terminal domain-containing protein [Acidobacteriaceae bacterium]
MRIFRIILVLLAVIPGIGFAHALDRQPFSDYHARRVQLGEKLKGGVAVLFAAEEPSMEYLDFRQDEDFYYLTGWNEPGAALLVQGAAKADGDTPAHPYREILFLPTRNLRLEQYTGVKMDAAAPGVTSKTGVDEVLPMTELPSVLNKLISADRQLANHLWSQQDVPQSKALIVWTAETLGMDSVPSFRDVRDLTMQLRLVKDDREIALIRKATEASMAGQLAGMQAIRPSVTERTISGIEIAKQMQHGCERPSYPPIVGSGPNSTELHYSENSRTMQAGDIVVIDEACEYSMYASDITRTMPVDGHFTPRQREIYNIVLGAQRAAAAAFVAGKSQINDPLHKEADSLDEVAYNYINTHGKDLHGQPLGKYFIHGLGHSVGIDVHDPMDYPATHLDKGMVFTIEPGIYIPEEHLGVRIEDVFYVDHNGKLVDLVANLPHTAEDIEKAMQK